MNESPVTGRVAIVSAAVAAVLGADTSGIEAPDPHRRGSDCRSTDMLPELRDGKAWGVMRRTLSLAVITALVMAASSFAGSGVAAAAAPFFGALPASMTTTRLQPLAAALPDGRVLIAGGENTATRTSTPGCQAPSSTIPRAASSQHYPHR
jgi:hypothetical protein